MGHKPDPADELLSRLKRGDQDALAELFARDRPALRRMVAWRLDRRLRGRVDPSDVLQEVYIDATQRPDYLNKPTMPFSLWLRLLTSRRLLEMHRQHLGAKMRDAGMEISLDLGPWPAAAPDQLAAHLTGQLTSPSRAAMRAEAEAKLVAALNRMDPIDREVLVLRHFEDLGNNDVAALFGIRKAAASHRYVRALERLREVLADVSEFLAD